MNWRERRASSSVRCDVTKAVVAAAGIIVVSRLTAKERRKKGRREDLFLMVVVHDLAAGHDETASEAGRQRQRQGGPRMTARCLSKKSPSSSSSPTPS